MTKKYFFYFLVLFLAFNVVNLNSEKITTPERNIQIHLSYEASLAYSEYIYFHFIADENDIIRWEFSGTNSYVGVTVYAMTKLEFEKFQNLQIYYRYILSDGTNYRDSGVFHPLSNDDWYIMFYNDDSSVQITYLTYDVEIDRGGDFNFGGIIAIVIIVLIVGALIGVGISIKGKKKREEIHYNKVPTNPNQIQPKHIENLKYCSQCGSPQNLVTIYCVKCGNKFD
ncbi:hypothetical protein LCGC14_0934990 [marine sediment metagenome]|uniref:Uncharacterized protein n=1 Tax=marine sediment metagenome TaxID=412755 RepID=A0A0F9RTE4_9ZZZZ